MLVLLPLNMAGFGQGLGPSDSGVGSFKRTVSHGDELKSWGHFPHFRPSYPSILGVLPH